MEHLTRPSLAAIALMMISSSSRAQPGSCQQHQDRGFQRTFFNQLGRFDNRITTAVAADLDGDGIKEIIFVRDEELFALEPDGADVPGFPVNLPALANVERTFLAGKDPLAIGDFAHDGTQQIVLFVTVVNQFLVEQTNILFVLNYDGTVWPGWPSDGVELTRGVATAPTVFDLDHDGVPEIILAGGFFPQNWLYVLRADGSSYNSNFPRIGNGYPINSTIAVADINQDGVEDLVFVGDGSAVHALDSDTGVDLAGWPVQIGYGFGSFRTSVAIADLDGDGALEVIATADQDQAFVFRSDGSLYPGWPIDAPHILTSPSVASLTASDELQIAFGSERQGESTAQVNLVQRDGKPLPGWPQEVGASAFNNTNTILADLDGDGERDLIYLSYNGAWYVWHSNGDLFPGFPTFFIEPNMATNVASSPVVADLWGDGTRQVLLTLFFNGSLSDPPETYFAKLIVVDFDSCSPELPGDWSIFHRDNQHTGRVLP